MQRLSCLALLAALLVPHAARAAEPPILSEGARSLPVIARHGMVVAQEGTAARVGLEILKRGGNAVDAAVATAFALAVTLPRAGNLGGGGFMLVHLAKQDTTVAIDYRELAPVSTKPDVFLDAAGDAVARLSRDTGLAVGVPGTVAGLALALDRYGSHKLTLADLEAPAEKLARDGIPVEDDLADSLAKSTRLKRWPSSAAIFLHADGSPLGHGEFLRQTDLADTLATIGREGPKGFYGGPVARKIVAAIERAGGAMTMDDLRSYRVIERAPVTGSYRGHTIVSMPPPSSGGVHVIELLNILEGFPLAAQGALSARTIHDMAEAEKLAYADRAEYLGDPATVNVPVKGLVSKAYAAKLRGLIEPDRAKPAAEIAAIDPAPYESEQTTHFSVVDADGNAVANTYTLNLSFGVGLVADGTGVLLNDELDDFAAKPGAPNAFGLTGGKANAPGPRKPPAVVDDADDDVQGRQARAGHRLARRLDDHHHRAAAHPGRGRLPPEHRHGHRGATRARPAHARQAVRRAGAQPRHAASAAGHGLHAQPPRRLGLGLLDRACGWPAGGCLRSTPARHAGGGVLSVDCGCPLAIPQSSF